MANVFNVRGGHAFMDRMCAFLCVLMEREHCRLSQKLEKKSGMQRSVPHASDWPNTGRKLGPLAVS